MTPDHMNILRVGARVLRVWNENIAWHSPPLNKESGPYNVGHYLMRCDTLRHQFSVAFQMN